MLALQSLAFVGQSVVVVAAGKKCDGIYAKRKLRIEHLLETVFLFAPHAIRFGFVVLF
jgi:2-hydroxy-3-keto-5-methylthiopentenyl-1-phosphate phosphatase